MNEIIEVKIKFSNNNSRWEDVPVSFEVYEFSSSTIGQIKKLLSCQFVREIRWNYKGSLQGHYYSQVEWVSEYE